VTGTAYARGDHFEKRVLHALVSDGYLCWQTRGSKSFADLIAIKPGQVVLLQVKSGQTPISHEGWNGLLVLARKIGGIPVLADRELRGIRYRELAGVHLPRSQHWPTRPWSSDSVVDE
jgi:Holliday junction resolvase